MGGGGMTRYYTCVACNENCTNSEHQMRDMGLLDGDEVYNTLCPYWGEFTEFLLDKEEEE